MAKALFLLRSLSGSCLNPARRRLGKLLAHLDRAGIVVDLHIRDGSAVPSELTLGLRQLRLRPWTERQAQMWDRQLFPADYAMVFADSGLTTPDTSGALLFLPLSDGAPVAASRRSLSFDYPAPAAGEESVMLPLDTASSPQEGASGGWFEARPGLLLCLDPVAANVPALAGFVESIWPAIFELCPQLVLRLPDGFRGLGIADRAGIEWVAMASTGAVEGQLRTACAAVLPRGSGIEGLDKHALFARHGLPCLGGEDLGAGLVPPLRFDSPTEAALLAYRLLFDARFRARSVQAMHDFAGSAYGCDRIYRPIDALLGL